MSNKKAFEAKEKEYKFTEKMDEISGLGGSYEEVCRKMVTSGVEWIHENPKADIITEESDDIEKLQDVMVKASGDDCTGAMMQTTFAHVQFIKKNGWKKYVQEMEERKEGLIPF